MFPPEHREQVRNGLIERARADPRIVAAAVTGSAARDSEDQYSDVDLFFGVSPATVLPQVLDDWTTHLYRQLGAIHHFDLPAGAAVYRAFLLTDLLEVDLGFTPAARFGPLGDGAFRLVFGTAADRQPSPLDPDHLAGLAWHHVRHARTCIARGALWQAEYWVSALRDTALTLACHRLGYPVHYAKGADRLPAQVIDPLRQALVGALDAAELTRALRAAAEAVLRELRVSAPDAAAVLEPALRELAGR